MSGPFGSTAWMYNPSTEFYGFPITNSLRFEDGDSAYLNRTPGSAGNRKTWTWSGWVKRGNLSTNQALFTADPDNPIASLFFQDDNILYFYAHSGSAYLFELRTTQLFRDTSAWYHIVAVLDTSNSTSGDRVKLYVNGVRVSDFSTESYPALNFESRINDAVLHKIGYQINASRYLDGYLSDVNFIDGTALTPSSFGETKNDIWIPKNTSGLTFGTNGFRLQFKQTGTGTASSSTIGADTSGETNHWTSNNLVASDVMPDSPTNNFATMNPLDSSGTLAEGNLKFSDGTGSGYKANSTMTIPNIADSQKYYVEFVSDLGYITGIIPEDITGANNNAVYNVIRGYYPTGSKYTGTSASSYGASFGTGDQMGMLIGNGAIEFFKNSASQGVAFSSLTGAYKVVSSAFGNAGAGIIFNFGQDSSFAGAKTAQGETDANGIGDFYYDEASSGLALCTSNMTDPVETIDPAQGGSVQDYFNTVLWTGNDTSGRAITGVGFQPDFVWIKNRAATYYHSLSDTVRGITRSLSSNATDAEVNYSNISAVGSDGFTISGAELVNKNAQAIVAWNWKAGTAFSNDASATGVGSIDSAGSVSADTGFSIINFTGTGSALTVAHGLSKAPELIIEKSRDKADYWLVYAAPIGNTHGLILSGTNAALDSDTFWNDTSPTSTVWTMGTQNAVNNSGQETIAYCFHSVDGYSKFGSYTGNGNADGPFVYTGFRPAFVIIKRTNLARNWVMFDDARNPFNEMKLSLEANVVDAEYDNSNAIDFVSNGFKPRVNTPSWNASGGTYIYMAFAEQPFKYSNAR